MKKSLVTHEHRVFLDTLAHARRGSKMTQVDVAERLGTTQSHISKIERGEIRVDIVQLRTICHVLGLSLPAFVRRFERRLAEQKRSGNEDPD